MLEDTYEDLSYVIFSIFVAFSPNVVEMSCTILKSVVLQFNYMMYFIRCEKGYILIVPVQNLYQ
jgi:hypothetical protein